MLVALAISAVAQEAAHTPQLLLNAQRLRRLKRDRERKTVRWVNFENRVNSVPDSPERGFELALYYAVTGDEAKGREAVQWALSHNSPRQNALVLDWCLPLVSIEQKKNWRFFTTSSTVNLPMSFARLLVQPGSLRRRSRCQYRALHSARSLMDGYCPTPRSLYALCELIYAVRAATHTDLARRQSPFLFRLPAELLLLSAKPSELNSPPWIHARRRSGAGGPRPQSARFAVPAKLGA